LYSSLYLNLFRLQCIQAAISDQIETLAKEKPKTRVALVTFNNEVTLFGGLTENSVVITGDKLNNSQTLMQIGKEFQKNLIPIGECKEKILKQLFNLSENGPTALGPAVLASIGICDILGSKKMIICTDGLSNIGIGSLDELHTNEEKEESRQTYEGFGIEAQSKGIAISVLSIKGSDTRIETLGKLCEITGGSIERVEPTEITKKFQWHFGSNCFGNSCQLQSDSLQRIIH